MIKAVIFDNDGVIIDSEPMHIESDMRILKEYGIEWTADKLHRFIGVKDTEMWEILIEELNLPDSVEMLKEKKARIRKEVFVPERIVPICGIPELFKAIHQKGLRIAVASSSPRHQISPWLEQMNLLPYLDVFLTGDDVTNGKPHPEPYKKAAALLGLLPSECVAIEDSPHGVESSKEAGCFCIGFRTPGGIYQDLSKADVIVHAIPEILEKNLLEKF